MLRLNPCLTIEVETHLISLAHLKWSVWFKNMGSFDEAQFWKQILFHIFMSICICSLWCHCSIWSRKWLHIFIEHTHHSQWKSPLSHSLDPDKYPDVQGRFSSVVLMKTRWQVHLRFCSTFPDPQWATIYNASRATVIPTTYFICSEPWVWSCSALRPPHCFWNALREVTLWWMNCFSRLHSHSSTVLCCLP